MLFSNASSSLALAVVLLFSYITCASTCRIVPSSQVSSAVRSSLDASKIFLGSSPYGQGGKAFTQTNPAAQITIHIMDNYQGRGPPGASLKTVLGGANDLDMWFEFLPVGIYVVAALNERCDLVGLPHPSAVERVTYITARKGA